MQKQNSKEFDALIKEVLAFDVDSDLDHRLVNILAQRRAKWLKERAGKVVYRINTVLGLAEATAAGIGFGLLPCFIGSKTPGLTRITPPIADIVDGLWLLTHSDLRQTARVRAFMDFAGSEIGKRHKEMEGMN